MKDLDRRNLENCKIIYRLKDGLPVIEGDKAQLRQVIKNLIINGAEAITNSGGEIIIETGIIDCNRSYLSKHYLDDKLPEGSYVYLNVKDNGSGMTDEIKEKIFDPLLFYKIYRPGSGTCCSSRYSKRSSWSNKSLKHVEQRNKFQHNISCYKQKKG